MILDTLIPFNGQIVQTSDLKKLGLKPNDINKLLDNKSLERTKRGYYKVNLNNEDVRLMTYYLMNSLYEDFEDYFNTLPSKGYNAYYYHFIYDIMNNDYSNAYKDLTKCCDLNKEKKNKVNLYVFVLLLQELMGLSNRKLVTLRKKIFKDEEDALSSFLEFVIKKDYDGAYKSLRVNPKHLNLSKLEIKVLRDLSVKAKENNYKKNSKEMIAYNNLYNSFYQSIFNRDYENAHFYFLNLTNLASKLGIKDRRLEIINNLFACFDYIASNPSIDLDTYKTNFHYKKNNIDNFYEALHKKDYLKAYQFTKKIIKDSDNKDFIIYHNLLERIYNFLHVRENMKIFNHKEKYGLLNNLIRNKKYEEALTIATKIDNMNDNDKNIVVFLLESLVALDDNSLFAEEN